MTSNKGNGFKLHIYIFLNWWHPNNKDEIILNMNNSKFTESLPSKYYCE